MALFSCLFQQLSSDIDQGRIASDLVWLNTSNIENIVDESSCRVPVGVSY
jgi:hypothetical protein